MKWGNFMRERQTDLSWQAPGPGQWDLDRSHVFRPATAINQHIQSSQTIVGSRRVLEELGAPVDGLDFRFVNGLVYSRVRPLIGADKPPAKAPPLPLLKIAVRLHPEMRRRRKIADRVLNERPWRKMIEEWQRDGGLRDQYEQANLALQDVDRTSLTDDALVRHVNDVLNHCLEMWARHFWLHGYDLGPIGLLLFNSQKWGLTTAEVTPLLEGASPSTSEAERVLRRIRDAVTAAGAQPRSLDELRAVSPEIDRDVSNFLRLRGALVVTRYDIDGLTLREAPEVLFATIMSARDNEAGRSELLRRIAERTAAVRAKVPAQHRAEFDTALLDARAAMDLRDDNGPRTLEWPLGLMRLALLEVGRRMVDRGHAHDVTHALEVAHDEIGLDLLSGTGPTADELAARAHWRETVDVSNAPLVLGTPEPPPPLEVLPSSLAQIAGFVASVLAEAGLNSEKRTSGLHGVGVGDSVYRGVARCAATPEQALESLEPGDVLVVPCTTPAYNMVLSLAGAVVTAEGGALSHAAVLARELGIPAVVGAPEALRGIPDGAIIEVDPVRGEVRVVQ